MIKNGSCALQLCSAILISISMILAGCGHQGDQAVAVSPTTTKAINIQPTNTQLILPLLDVGDGGFLSKQPCGPPCFWGMTSDMTKEDVVLDFLQKKSILDTCEKWDTRASGGDRGIGCGSNTLVFTFQDSNLVDMISFTPSEKFTIGDVIAAYGELDGIFVVDEADKFGNIIWVAMDILYYDMNATVGLPMQYSTSYIITEQTEVTNVMYRGHLEYEKHQIYGAKPWKGFGEYPPSTLP